MDGVAIKFTESALPMLERYRCEACEDMKHIDFTLPRVLV